MYLILQRVGLCTRKIILPPHPHRQNLDLYACIYKCNKNRTQLFRLLVSLYKEKVTNRTFLRCKINLKNHFFPLQINQINERLKFQIV